MDELRYSHIGSGRGSEHSGVAGDPPKGAINWRPIKNGVNNAIDLVKLIREEHGDYFCIAVAGFPEGHPYSSSSRTNSPNKSASANSDEALLPPPPPQNYEGYGKCTCSPEDIALLKAKVDAGADFILTQFFYDSQVFIDYMKVCKKEGIHCPILPGIMPVQGYSSFQKMTQFCRTRVPDKIWADLAGFRENDEEVKAYGVALCIKICKTLREAGVPGFHFYTLNLEKSVGLILDGISAKKDLATRRALPWRGSRTGAKNLGYDSHSTSGNSGSNLNLLLGTSSHASRSQRSLKAALESTGSIMRPSSPARATSVSVLQHHSTPWALAAPASVPV